MKLEIKDLNKSFGEKHVLKDISFSVESGRSLGLLGRNGAGKTTSIRIIMGVFPGDDGSILIDGQKVDYSKLKVGYLPEERGLYPKKTIIDQLTYFSKLKGMSHKDAVTANDYWLQKLGMSEYRDKKLSTLSKGNQQKIQLITAIAFDPDIVILDEPFSGLDPVNSILLKDVVKTLIERNKLVIFSSHQMSYVEEFCDDIAIINQGEIAVNGNIKEIIRSYPRNKIAVSAVDIKKISNSIKWKNYIEGDELIVELDNPNQKKEVMSYISENFDIDGVYVKEPSLTDIFVEYTHEAI